MNYTYKCASRTFDNLNEAMAYAKWLFKISGIVVAIERA